MNVPERCPLLDAMLEADLNRRLAQRAVRRPILSTASRKGWQTRIHNILEHDPLDAGARGVNSTKSARHGPIGCPL